MDEENRPTLEGLRFVVVRRGGDPILMQKDGKASSERYWNFERVFLVILLTFEISSVVLGIVAEVYSFKEYVMLVDGECVYSDNFATILAFAAVVALLVAQVLVTMIGCYQRLLPNDRFLVGSWITLFIAAYLFTAGVRARQGNEHHQYSGHAMCEVVKFGVYLKGSGLAFIAMVEQLAYYISVSEARTLAKASYTRITPDNDSAETV